MTTYKQASSGAQGYFRRQEPTAESDAAALARLERLSVMLDSTFRLPIIGTRIGFDPLLNLIPGAGVLVAKSLTGYIIWEAHRLGAPKHILGRMITNLGIDFGISIVPLAGWVGDVFFRANLRNVALLRAHLQQRVATHGVKAAQPESVAPVIDGDWVRKPA